MYHVRWHRLVYTRSRLIRRRCSVSIVMMMHFTHASSRWHSLWSLQYWWILCDRKSSVMVMVISMVSMTTGSVNMMTYVRWGDVIYNAKNKKCQLEKCLLFLLRIYPYQAFVNIRDLSHPSLFSSCQLRELKHPHFDLKNDQRNASRFKKYTPFSVVIRKIYSEF